MNDTKFLVIYLILFLLFIMISLKLYEIITHKRYKMSEII